MSTQARPCKGKLGPSIGWDFRLVVFNSGNPPRDAWETTAAHRWFHCPHPEQPKSLCSKGLRRIEGHGAPENGPQTTCDSPHSQPHTKPMETSTRVADAAGGVLVASSRSVIGQLKSWQRKSTTRNVSPARACHCSGQAPYCWRSLALGTTPTCCFSRREF